MSKILILCSGFSANQIKENPELYKDYNIVAVNHGYMASDNWKYWVAPLDFSGVAPKKSRDDQLLVRKYNNELNKYGGIAQCGRSITLAASYWVLCNLKPTEIGYLGADMNYTPDDKGDTHIYGLGLDIKKNGIPDPVRMARQYKKTEESDDEYIENIYMRFYNIATEQGVNVFNLSNDPDTKLPYPRKVL